MRNFTLRKGFLEHRFGTRSSFKSFVVFVVMMIMATSSAMAEVIDGLRYDLNSEKKTATLLPKKMINIPVISLFQRRLRVMMGWNMLLLRLGIIVSKVAVI